MGLDELESRIKKDAEEKIQVIDKETEEKIAKLRDEINQEAKAESGKILREGEQEAKLAYRRIIADIVIKGKDKIEKEKNTIIDEAFNKTRDSILKSSESDKTRFLNKLVDKDKNKVPNPKVIVDKKYAPLLKNSVAADLGDFGVIIESKDGKVRIDNTLNSKIERLKVTLKPQISSLLFK